jgi:hypothetical protein
VRIVRKIGNVPRRQLQFRHALRRQSDELVLTRFTGRDWTPWLPVTVLARVD